MKHTRIYALAIFGLTLGSCGTAAEKKDQTAGQLFPKGKLVTNSNFTGTVYLQGLVEADSLNPIGMGNVSFEAGARTKWHSHPAGQIIMATEGVGYYQEQGKTKMVVHKGDIIKCAPNTIHWHGASKDSAFVQLAITGTQNGPPVWLHPVSDQEYLK
jgi:quercetin dioxygenase-like cupin family protein